MRSEVVVKQHGRGYRLYTTMAGILLPANLHLVGGDATKLDGFRIPSKKEAIILAGELQEQIDGRIARKQGKKLTKKEQEALSAQRKINTMKLNCS